MASPSFFLLWVRTLRLRRWRSMLAVLLSLALVISWSHCWCLDDDDGTLTVSVAATACDSGKASTDAHTPHCDHCMAHVITVAPPATSAGVEYVTGHYLFAAARAPEAADLASPFKPPRV
jgi:hypothetical protein